MPDRTFTFPHWLSTSAGMQNALRVGQPIVALESTLIAHGLPWPLNLQTACEAEQAVRDRGAFPATIAVLRGVPTVGLTQTQLEELARATDVHKASRRDLGPAVALKQNAATTVSATMALAHAAGIRVFATGGLGGAHRNLGSDATASDDVSADLLELARTPVLVVCAGAKSILDLPRTLEMLETLAVPVVGYRTSEFPAFYVRDHIPALPVSARVDSVSEAAALFAAHVQMGGAGAVLAQPCPAEVAIPATDFAVWLADAERDALRVNVTGAKVTPFLLARIAERSAGRTLVANRALIVANARLAAETAVALSKH